MTASCSLCPKKRFGSAMAVAAHMRDKHGIAVVEPLADEPVTCIECGSEASPVKGDRIYPHRPDLYAKNFWLCECGAYCGCHGVTTRPLGSPCGPETRRARQAAHAAFDPLWKSREMSRYDAYQWLSIQMDIDRDLTHIGMFNRDQALAVVEHCRERRRKAA